MTVSSIDPVNNYAGDSSNTKFDFDFLIENESELVVQHTNSSGVTTILQNNVDYSINEIGNANGSYITFPVFGSSYGILKPDEKISLMLTLVIKQEKEIKNSLFFDFNLLEWMFDYIVRILQILSRRIDRSIKVREGSSVNTDKLSQSLLVVEENIQSVNGVAENISNISAAGSSITNINAVASDLSVINALAQDLSDIENVKIWAEGTDEQVQAIGGTHSSKGWSLLSENANTSLSNLSLEGEAKFTALQANIDNVQAACANLSLSNLNSSANAKFQYAPFTINNGAVDNNGDNATLTTSGGTPVSVDKYVIPVLTSTSSTYGTASDIKLTATTGVNNRPSNPWTMQLANDNYIPAGAEVTFTISTKNFEGQPAEYRDFTGCTGVKITYTYTDNTTEDILNEDNTGNFAGWVAQGNHSATITLPVASKEVKTVTITGYYSFPYTYRYYSAWGVTLKAKYNVNNSSTLICNPCTITTADSKTKTFTADNLLDCSSVSNGTYYVMKSYTDGSLSLANTINVSKTAPSSPSSGDLWLDNSQYPLTLKRYNNGSFTDDNDIVSIGTVTVSSGLITDIKNNYFNACPAMRYVVKTYKNGASWYEIYADGWLKQGGNCTSGTAVVLLKAFSDANYTLSSTYSAKSTSGFTPTVTGDWFAEGQGTM